jgi:hypothetical protein
MESKRPFERRAKSRFEIERELRYKVLVSEQVVGGGAGCTLDISSGGVAFISDRQFQIGDFIELSISWPVLLEDRCPMRLTVFGRVLRVQGVRVACTVDRHEFRIQARTDAKTALPRNDGMLARWAETFRREGLKTAAATTA